MTKVVVVLRARWMYLLGVIPVVVASLTTSFSPSPGGHWRDHLGGAALDWSATAVLVTSAWLMKHRLGWTTLVVPVIAGAMLVAGWADLLVARSIWRVAGSETSVIQATDRSAFLRGHEMAATTDLIMLATGLAFVLAVGLTKRVTTPAAFVALILAILPPWIAGGFGAWWIIARAHTEWPRTAGAEME